MAQKGEVRAHREELQRVQIGLVGLAAVLLIVTLANLVVQTARGDKSSNGTPVVIDESAIGIVVPNGSGSAQPSANEPLADLGVTPTADSAAAPAPQSTAPSGAVPDLEPDPRLRERMDQDADRTNSTR